MSYTLMTLQREGREHGKTNDINFWLDLKCARGNCNNHWPLLTTKGRCKNCPKYCFRSIHKNTMLHFATFKTKAGFTNFRSSIGYRNIQIFSNLVNNKYNQANIISQYSKKLKFYETHLNGQFLQNQKIVLVSLPTLTTGKYNYYNNYNQYFERDFRSLLHSQLSLLFHAANVFYISRPRHYCIE